MTSKLAINRSTWSSGQSKSPAILCGAFVCNSTDIWFHQLNKLMKLFRFLRRVMKDYHHENQNRSYPLKNKMKA
jgi:hypothetical protein